MVRETESLLQSKKPPAAGIATEQSQTAAFFLSLYQILAEAKEPKPVDAAHVRN